MGFSWLGVPQNGWFIKEIKGKSCWNGWFGGTPILGNHGSPRKCDFLPFVHLSGTVWAWNMHCIGKVLDWYESLTTQNYLCICKARTMHSHSLQLLFEPDIPMSEIYINHSRIVQNLSRTSWQDPLLSGSLFSSYFLNYYKLYELSNNSDVWRQDTPGAPCANGLSTAACAGKALRASQGPSALIKYGHHLTPIHTTQPLINSSLSLKSSGADNIDN